MRGVLLSGVAASVLLAPPAIAQSTAAEAGSASENRSTAADAQSEAVPDIIVTAQRRAENLQNVAIPVNAIGGDALVRAGVTQALDLSRIVPALSVAPSGSQSQFYIRGVGNYSGVSYAEQAVAFSLDGVYLARPSGPSGLFFDVDRVEVLKGPQGTLYGRNATGGAVNLITRRPELSRSGFEGGAEVGNYDLIRIFGAANIAVSDTAALRFSAQSTYRNGYLSDGTDDDKGVAVRLQGLLEPTSDLSILLSGNYYFQYGKGSGGILVPFVDPDRKRLSLTEPEANAAFRRRYGYAGAPLLEDNAYFDNHYGMVSATIAWNLGPAELTIIPAYRKTVQEIRTYPAGFQLNEDLNTRQLSTEVRLASTGDGALKWLIGGYWFNERNRERQYNIIPTAITDLNLERLTTSSLAAFGQASLTVLSGLRVTAGARYTSERKRQQGITSNTQLAVFISPAVGYLPIQSLLPPGAPIPVTTAPTDGRLTADRVTWKAGLEWDVAPRSLLYATVATGFKAGGFYASAAPNTFRPELLTAYTLGSKNRFMNGRLQLNLEGFYWDYQDKQVTHVGPIRPRGFGLITENAGDTEIYGVDADMVFSPVKNGRFNVGVQYLHTRIKEFTFEIPATGPRAINCAVTLIPSTQPGNPAVPATLRYDCAGKPLSQAPKWIFNVGYEQGIDLANGGKVTLAAATHFESAKFLSIEYRPEQRQGSFTNSRLSVTYENPDRRWSLQAYVNNLENETVLANAFLIPGATFSAAQLQPPRTVGLRLDLKL